MLKRTLRDFCDLAYKEYGDELGELGDRMLGLGVTDRQLLCYINWVHGMTQVELAAELEVDQSTICRDLEHLSDVLPYLFDFQEKGQMEQYRSRRHDRVATHRF